MVTCVVRAVTLSRPHARRRGRRRPPYCYLRVRAHVLYLASLHPTRPSRRRRPCAETLCRIEGIETHSRALGTVGGGGGAFVVGDPVVMATVGQAATAQGVVTVVGTRAAGAYYSVAIGAVTHSFVQATLLTNAGECSRVFCIVSISVSDVAACYARATMVYTCSCWAVCVCVCGFVCVCV